MTSGGFFFLNQSSPADYALWARALGVRTVDLTAMQASRGERLPSHAQSERQVSSLHSEYCALRASVVELPPLSASSSFPALALVELEHALFTLPHLSGEVRDAMRLACKRLAVLLREKENN